MKIELYLVPGCKNGELLKRFLERNKLSHKEVITEDINVLRKVVQGYPFSKISMLRIKYSSAIHVIRGFQPLALKQLLEHVNKYKPKIE